MKLDLIPSVRYKARPDPKRIGGNDRRTLELLRTPDYDSTPNIAYRTMHCGG